MDKSLLLSAEVQAFIKKHEADDLNALLLQRNKYPGWSMPVIVEQIKARNKTKAKLPTWYKQEGILFPKPVSIEQASSEQTAQWKAHYLGEGVSGVDLTGGFGVDSFYFAKNYTEWLHVEPNQELHELVRHNFSVLGCKNVRFSNLTAEKQLNKLEGPIDLVYLDPDRRPAHRRVAGFRDSTPDVTALLAKLRQQTRQVLIKASPMIDIKAGMAELGNVKKVIILGVNNEVKEVLFHLDFTDNSTPIIRCINLKSIKEEVFEYLSNEYLQEDIKISSLFDYLFEPNAMIMKSGGQDILAKHFGLSKLQRNTNLYTATSAATGFPGRVFKVIANLPYKKKEVARFLPEGKANLSSRNFVDSPEQMKKKLGIRDGGEIYLFGYRDQHNQNKVAICQKYHTASL